MGSTPFSNRVPLRNEKARRLVQAVLENVADWEVRCLEIAEHEPPGNKSRALSLARDMEQCRVTLTRMVKAVLESEPS